MERDGERERERIYCAYSVSGDERGEVFGWDRKEQGTHKLKVRERKKERTPCFYFKLLSQNGM